jgi:hypothetical protein
MDLKWLLKCNRGNKRWARNCDSDKSWKATLWVTEVHNGKVASVSKHQLKKTYGGIEVKILAFQTSALEQRWIVSFAAYVKRHWWTLNLRGSGPHRLSGRCDEVKIIVCAKTWTPVIQSVIYKILEYVYRISHWNIQCEHIRNFLNHIL